MSERKVYIGVEAGKEANGADLHDVAVWNEFGTETIPPRPAFRQGSEQAVKSLKKQIQAFMINIARDQLGKKRPDNATTERRFQVLLTQLGRVAASNVRKIIQAGSTAPNAPATVAKKGFDHPLFETGTLLKNVSYKVVNKK